MLFSLYSTKDRPPPSQQSFSSYTANANAIAPPKTPSFQSAQKIFSHSYKPNDPKNSAHAHHVSAIYCPASFFSLQNSSDSAWLIFPISIPT